MKKFYLLCGIVFLLVGGCSTNQINSVEDNPTPLSTGNVSIVEVQSPTEPQLTEVVLPYEKTSPIPSGLIYLFDGKIWFDHNDGIYKSVVIGTSEIALSHTKNKAVFEFEHSIHLINFDDSTEISILYPDYFDLSSPTWSPDDSLVFFIQKEYDQFAEIYLFDIATKKISNVSNSPQRYEIEIDYHSGLYEPTRDIFIVTSGTYGKPSVPGQILNGHCHADFEECSSFPTIFGVHHKQYEVIDYENGMNYLPALSLNGGILYYDGGVMYNLDTAKKTIFDPADSGLDMMYSSSSKNPQLVAPILSPDGEKIVWTAHIINEFDNDIVLQDKEIGAAQLILSYDPYYATATLPPWQRWLVPHISWSPDSQWICIADETWGGDNEDKKIGENGRIWLISQDGLTVNEIPAGDFFHDAPIWNPESTQLIFTKIPYGDRESEIGIFLLDVNTLELSEVDFHERVEILDWR